MNNVTPLIDELELARFLRDGYVVVPRLADPARVSMLRQTANDALSPLLGPAEFETDVGYPGAPVSRDADGGSTPRRLLHALGRDAEFRRWAQDAQVGARVRSFLGSQDVRVSQSHHNCIMTKHSGFSSRTGWHQDVRYWSFDRPDLVSVWLALNDEREANGALSLIPGSHRWELDRGRLNAALFLRDDLPENEDLLRQAQLVELNAGDALFFHCNLFHAAGTNRTDQVKLAAVFTYHSADNHPIPGTRSAALPSLAVL